MFRCGHTHALGPNHWRTQVEDKFSPYAKQTLANLVKFVQVSSTGGVPELSPQFVHAAQEEVEPALKIAAAQLPTDPELRWKTEIPILEELKSKARKLGLWNLFLSKAHYPRYGVPLTNLEVSQYSLTSLFIRLIGL